MKLLRKGRSIFDRINDALAFLAALLLIFIMLAVGADVTMRFLLNRPLHWVMETTEFCLLLVTFIGASWLLRKEGHVSLDIVLNRLNPRAQSIVTIVTSLISAIVCLGIVWYGTQVAWVHFQRGTVQTVSVAIPTTVFVGTVTVGCCLLLIQFLIRSYSHLERWRALHNK